MKTFFIYLIFIVTTILSSCGDNDNDDNKNADDEINGKGYVCDYTVVATNPRLCVLYEGYPDETVNQLKNACVFANGEWREDSSCSQENLAGVCIATQSNTMSNKNYMYKTEGSNAEQMKTECENGGGEWIDAESASDNPDESNEAPDKSDNENDGPVVYEWKPFGPAMPSSGGVVVNNILVDGSTVYVAGLINSGTNLSVRYYDGVNSWEPIPVKASNNTQWAAFSKFNGAIFIGAPDGYSEEDAKIYRKKSGENEFGIIPVNLFENLGGVADFLSIGESLYVFNYKCQKNDALLVSNDGGDSFSKVSNEIPTFNGYPRKVIMSGSKTLVSNGSFLYYSDKIEGPYEMIEETKEPVVYASDGTIVVVQIGKTGVILYSDSTGIKFSESSLSLGNFNAKAIITDNGCFFMSSQKGIYRSCDGGIKWDDISEGAPKESVYIKNPPSSFAVSDNYIYGAFGEQIYRYPTK